MNALRRAADRMVGLFVPKVTASAVWYWDCQSCQQPNSASQPTCGFRTWRWCSYCHDGSGYCNPPERRCGC